MPNAYGRLQEILKGLTLEEQGAINLFDIAVVRPSAPIVRQMWRRYGEVPGVKNFVRRISLDSDEAYVYELKAPEDAEQPSEEKALAGAAA